MASMIGRRLEPFQKLHPLGACLGGLLVAGGLAPVAYLNTVGPDARLDFLKGRPLLESTVSSFGSESRSSCDEFRVYAWPEPATDAFVRVDRELQTKDFRLVRRKGAWAEWKHDRWTVSIEASRPNRRAAALHPQNDPSWTMVVVSREVESDLAFEFRMMFSPYGSMQV